MTISDRIIIGLVFEVLYLHQQQTFFFFFFFFSNCSYSVITVQNIRLYLPSRDDWNKETIRYKPSPHQYDYKYSCPSLCCWHHPWCSDSLRVLGCDQLNKEILHRFSFHEYIAIRNILQRCSYCKSLSRTTAASLIPSTWWLSQTRQDNYYYREYDHCIALRWLHFHQHSDYQDRGRY